MKITITPIRLLAGLRLLLVDYFLGLVRSSVYYVLDRLVVRGWIVGVLI